MALQPELLWLTLTCSLMLAAGGLVKGTLGVGMPLVTVPLLSLVIPASQAIGLLTAPSLGSNLLQAWQGGRLRYALKRFGPLILAQLAATLLAVYWSRDFSVRALNLAISLTVITAVVLMVVQIRATVPARHERWAGPLVGAIAGFVGGLTSMTGPLLITYLMALRLKREEFVGSISIIYFFSGVPMYAAMLWWGRFGWTEVAWSCVAALPVYLGLVLGTRVRGRLSELVFRRALLGFLVLLALMLFLK